MRYGRTLGLALALGLVLGGCSKDDPQAFSKVDHNKDGKILFEELIVVFPDLTVEEFLAADSDHNESLDQKEYARFREARASGHKLDASSPAPAPAAAPAKAPEPAKTPEPAKPAEPAPAPQPAEPAKAPEPAKPASEAAPQQQPAPEASSQPAAASQPAQAATPAPGEAVETVVAEPPAPTPAPAPQEKTYTVVRGDNLTRIARKFGVSVKAIMAANNMKNADDLQAGATITIPSAEKTSDASAPKAPEVASESVAAAPAGVTDFIAGYFNKSTSGDINGLLDLYGSRVDYYKKGSTRRDIVRQDKAGYFQRWPKRSYTPGDATVKSLPDGNLRVTVPTTFAVKKDEKTVAGQATFTFVLHPVGDDFRIVAEKSVVTQRL